MKKLLLALLFLAGICIFAADNTEPAAVGLSVKALQPIPPAANPNEGVKCRGKLLRTEVRTIEDSPQIVCSLTVDGPYKQPKLKLAQQKLRVLTEFPVYETLLRRFIPDDNGVRGFYEYKPIAGEFSLGEETTRAEIVPDGPLAFKTVEVNSLTLTTDANGVIQDPAGDLDLFAAVDALNRRTAAFMISAEGFPPIEFVVFRTMPQRKEFDQKRLDEPDDQDLLIVCGLDFRQSQHEPEQSGLNATLLLPAGESIVRAGELFPLTVRVENRGQRATSCLLGRIFSRLPELNGKLFFFGAVPPGETREFTRLFKVNADNRISNIFAEVRFEDSWSTLKLALPVELTLLH